DRARQHPYPRPAGHDDDHRTDGHDHHDHHVHDYDDAGADHHDHHLDDDHHAGADHHHDNLNDDHHAGPDHDDHDLVDDHHDHDVHDDDAGADHHHHDHHDDDHHHHHHDPPTVRADRYGAADLGDLPDDEPRTARSGGREGLHHQCEHEPLRHLHQRRQLRRGDGHVRADALGRRGGCDAADADGHHDLHRDRGHLRRLRAHRVHPVRGDRQVCGHPGRLRRHLGQQRELPVRRHVLPEPGLRAARDPDRPRGPQLLHEDEPVRLWLRRDQHLEPADGRQRAHEGGRHERSGAGLPVRHRR